MLLEITVPPQTQGIVEIEELTTLTATVISAWQIKSEYGTRFWWSLSPQFLSCFNFSEDFLKIVLHRTVEGSFRLEVDFEDYDDDEEGQKIPNTEYIVTESLKVSAVKEVQNFPSITGV